MKTKHPTFICALFVAAVAAFKLASPPAPGAGVPGDLRDAVAEGGQESFDTALPEFKAGDTALQVPEPAGEISREKLLELESLANSEGMAPEQDRLAQYLTSLLSDRTFAKGGRGKSAMPGEGAVPANLPLLQYRKVPVQYKETQEEDSIKVDFWTAEDAGVDPTKGVLRLYRPDKPDAKTRPLIFFLPPSRDPRFFACQTFCEYFADHGMQCAYLEKVMRSPSLESPPDEGLSFRQAPPTSVVTARRALDALESMGVIRQGEKIGVGGISMGAIEASLIALTDERVGAASLILGGGNIAKMLVSINGSGVRSYMNFRQTLMTTRGWTLEDLERELIPYTTGWDPLTYIKAVPEERRLAADRFLMINVRGDPAITNERSDELYNALKSSSGLSPNYRRMTVLVPEAYKHVGIVLRIGDVKETSIKHFRRYLPAKAKPGI